MTADDPQLMERHVLADASVLVELVIDGRHRAAADRLLERLATEPDLLLLTAAHGLVEAASAVRRLALQGVLAVEDGATAVRWLAEAEVLLDPTGPRLRRVWQLRDRMSAYDAAYAAAAEDLALPLVTTDERLLQGCEAADIAAIHLRDLGR
jgi:predicted nucleic acid-binding protein